MIYDSYDMFWTEEGDGVIVEGDIFVTEFNSLIAIQQAARTRIENLKGSWALYPSVGVSYHPFGQHNTSEVAERWKEAVHVALTEDSMIESDDLSVDVVPLDPNTIMLICVIQVESNWLNDRVNEVIIYGVYKIEEDIVKYY